MTMNDIISLIIVFVVYFGPSIIASLRHRRGRGSVLVINLFFGWTLLGWVIALAMACGGTTDGDVKRDIERGIQMQAAANALRDSRAK